ncbi:MAG TPA: hypothetical protein VI078_17075 [bacterium]
MGMLRGPLAGLTVALALFHAAAAVGASRPAPGTVSPAAGAGNPTLFTATFTDADGWRDLDTVWFTLRSRLEPARSVRVLYRVATNRLSFNGGTAWRGSAGPGAFVALAGTWGRLYVRHCRASGVGATLTLRLYLGVKAGLEDRDLEVLIAARDRSGLTSAWKIAGARRAPSSKVFAFPVFPADNPWNTDISAAPVHPNSDAFIASIGASTGLHPDFGTAWEGSPIGIPYVRIGGAQPQVPISFYYPDESDPGPYPIPGAALIEGGPYASGDRHILLVDVDNLLLWEIYDARRVTGGWAAGSGAKFDLTSNALRPDGWTSADAAGLPILAGLVRYEEAQAGAINHALRFTASRTQRGYIHPATHFASSSTDAALPPMGLRVRLKAGYDTSGFPAPARVVLEALKKYGMILADNGSDWFISGAPNENWDDEALAAIRAVKGADFEAVYTGPILR